MLALAVATAPAMGAFALHERRRARRGRVLLIDPSLFSFRSLRGALLVTALAFAAVFGLFFTLALHLQGDRGWTPMQAAIIVIPWAAGSTATSSISSSYLVPRYGRRVLDVGLLAMIAGMSLLAWALSGAEPTPFMLAPVLLVAGFGMGMVLAPVLGLGLADVPTTLAGAASGVINNVQHVAGAMGMAILGGFYAARPATSGEFEPGHAFLPVMAGVIILLLAALASVRLIPR